MVHFKCLDVIFSGFLFSTICWRIAWFMPPFVGEKRDRNFQWFLLSFIDVTWFRLMVVRHAHMEGSNLDLGFGRTEQWTFSVLALASSSYLGGN